MTHVARVRRYYERNTRLFRAFGNDAATHTVHRAIWASGVEHKTQALIYVNEQIAAELSSDSSIMNTRNLHVIDLGCGVGGTICHLAKRFSNAFYGVGISISPTQIRLAQGYARRLGLDRYCVFMEGNFLHLPFVHAFDIAIAIEALVHAPESAGFLAQAASALRIGGRLIICDDFFSNPQPDSLVVDAFQRGWHAPGITTVAQLVAHAKTQQLRLVEQRDLTPDLRLLHLPHELVYLFLWLGRFIPADWTFTQSLLGGLALQYGLNQGLFCHQWLVFEKHI